MILFRNNGKYAMIVLLAFFWQYALEKSEEALGETVYGKCGSFLYRAFVLSAVFSAMHAEQGDRREMLSMPSSRWPAA